MCIFWYNNACIIHFNTLEIISVEYWEVYLLLCRWAIFPCWDSLPIYQLNSVESWLSLIRSMHLIILLSKSKHTSHKSMFFSLIWEINTEVWYNNESFTKFYLEILIMSINNGCWNSNISANDILIFLEANEYQYHPCWSYNFLICAVYLKLDTYIRLFKHTYFWFMNTSI